GAGAPGASLRRALNAVLAEERVPWAVHGTFSGFHFFLNPQRRPIDPHRFDPMTLEYKELLSNPPALSKLLRLALLANGVDVNGRIGGVPPSPPPPAQGR